MKSVHTKRIAFGGILAACYAIITVALAPLSYGAVQFRIAEALCILCCFTPQGIWGVTLGCFLANLISSVGPVDLAVGTVATLLSCFCVRGLKKLPWMTPVPVILINAGFVGAEIALFVSEEAFASAFWYTAMTVAAGETAVMYLVGVPLYYIMNKTQLSGHLREL